MLHRVSENTLGIRDNDVNISCIFKTGIVPAMPLLAALLVYVLARFTYFRQKEYELVTKRYLEEGIDAISKNVDRSLALCRHNWWQSTVVLKHFRDLGKDIPKTLYQEAFIAPDASLFEMWRDYRLVDLVGSVFNRAHQLLDAYVRKSYAFFQHDLGSMVRVAIEGASEFTVTAPRDEIVESYLSKIKELDTEAKRFYVLLAELQHVGSVLQSQRFSFKSISEFQNRPLVRKTVEIVNQHFPSNVESGSNGTTALPNKVLRTDAPKDGVRLS